MENNLRILIIIVLITLGCSKEEINNIEEIEEITNHPPNDFEILLKNITDSEATLSWSQANDPEGDTVKYSVYLEDKIVADKISELTFKIEGLTELTNYKGKIVAIDSYNNETYQILSFTTEKYYLKYLKKYDYGIDHNGNYASGSAYSMIKTSDNNYLIAGKTSNTIAGYIFFVIKIDYEGNVIWKKFYDYPIGDIMTFEIAESSNSYILAGYYHLLNIDYDGNLIWYKKIDSYDINIGPNEINSVKVDSKNNIFLAGVRFSFDSDIGTEAVLTKLDNMGNIIYEKTYKPTKYNLFNNLHIDSGDNLIILGSLDNADYSKSSSREQIDFWVLKLDNTGQIIWGNSFGDGAYDFPNNIIQKNNGNLVFAGESWGAYDIKQGRLFEIDPTGNELWNINTELNATHRISKTLDDGYITTGRIDNRPSILGIIKFNINGEQLWSKIYQEAGEYLGGISILAEDDGGYRIAGASSKIYYYNDEKPSLLIYKTDPNGVYVD